jgi:hypothetical protein
VCRLCYLRKTRGCKSMVEPRMRSYVYHSTTGATANRRFQRHKLCILAQTHRLHTHDANTEPERSRLRRTMPCSQALKSMRMRRARVRAGEGYGSGSCRRSCDRTPWAISCGTCSRLRATQRCPCRIRERCGGMRRRRRLPFRCRRVRMRLRGMLRRWWIGFWMLGGWKMTGRRRRLKAWPSMC